MSNDPYTEGGCCGTQTVAKQIGGIADGAETIQRNEDGSWPMEATTRNNKTGWNYRYVLAVGREGIVYYVLVDTVHVPIKRRKKRKK